MQNAGRMRFAVLAAILATVALAAPAGADTPLRMPTTLPAYPMPAATHTPHPKPSAQKTPAMSFGSAAAKGSVNSTACSRTAGSAQQQRTNPITGQPQAATIASVPMTKDGGSVKSATAAQQQADACAHSGH